MFRRAAIIVLMVVEGEKSAFGCCGFFAIPCRWRGQFLVVIFGRAGAYHASDSVFDPDQGSMPATLGLTANCNSLPFNSAIFVKKLCPVFLLGPICFEEQEQLDEAILDALRPLNRDIFCVATLDESHAELFKSIRVAGFPNCCRRSIIRILEEDNVIAQVGSKITKADRTRTVVSTGPVPGNHTKSSCRSCARSALCSTTTSRFT